MLSSADEGRKPDKQLAKLFLKQTKIFYCEVGNVLIDTWNLWFLEEIKELRVLKLQK